ncbi:Leu/Phe/Val dehydrogenase [Martelella soudanensis]|uniref:Leu/Phe/Val dehydrogenase n=1 Tax=unclassified Martelella TaxID=2629616 RepID=UPI0015DE0D6C|nr:MULTISPECIES: Glu/Leu/Phe/Val dehydrogenase [unclassified Martelella]
MSIFEHQDFDNHETVVFARDQASGLRAIIALHSTRLGPATGGCRLWAYDSEADALKDALRLSRGMSFKNAAAGLNLGGGKGVIMLEPGQSKTPELMRAFGRAVERLNGAYITAEDVGVDTDDMAEVRTETRHVTGLADGALASGDPSPVTARGVFESMKTAARLVLKRESLAGRHVAVQGLGHVGWRLCELLNADGASLTVADINGEHLEKAQVAFDAGIADTKDIHKIDCDIFAPCALGGILTRQTVPEVRARLIVGAANNQLAEESLAGALQERGITYLPDFIVNAGGIMNAAAEIEGVVAKSWIEEKLSGLQDQIERILEHAAVESRPPHQIAIEIAGKRLAMAR